MSEASPILSENVLSTQALRVRFLAVDPSGNNQTGEPTTWTNHLTLRNYFDEQTRTVELYVAPRGTIRYTLDGSEARNGETYFQPIVLPDSAQSVYVFAECEGLEEKRIFDFPAKGQTEKISLVKEKPAQMHCSTYKRLDNAAKSYEGLKLAKERGISFESVMIQIGSSPKIIHLSLGEMRIQPEFLEEQLATLQALLSPDAPVILSFRKVFTPSGFDLEQFANALGIELKSDEVIQE